MVQPARPSISARLVFSAAAWMVLASPVSAGQNTWTNIGPFLEGGQVQSLVIDPVVPTTLYAVSGGGYAVSGGIFRSVDGGSSWDLLSAGFVYPSSKFYSGFGFLSAGAIFSFAIDPKTPSTLYAGTFIGLVFKSVDAGATWKPASVGPESTDGVPLVIYDLAIDPAMPTTLYAVTRSGIFRSTDGGMNWVLLSSAVAGTLLRVDPRSPATLYAGSFNPGYCVGFCSEPSGTFHRSTDGGISWKELSARLLEIPNGSYPAISDLAFAGGNPSMVFAATSAGLFLSSDSGETWKRAAGLPKVVLTVAADRSFPTIWAGTLEGVFRSNDGGGTWEVVDQGLPDPGVSKLATAPSSSVAIPPFAPVAVYASTIAGLARSVDGGSSWIPLRTAFQKVGVGFLAVDPSSPSTLYAGDNQPLSSLGLVKSTNGGKSWTLINVGLTDLKVFDLTIDPITTSTLYAIAQSGIFKTTTAGATWFPLQGLPTSGPFALAVDPRRASTLYVTTETGLFKSFDGGGTWRALTAALPAPYVGAIAIDPTDPSTVYLGSSGGPLKSSDGGTTWRTINEGWPRSSSGSYEGVERLVLDPIVPSTLYALAFDSGWWKTHDAGVSWKPVNCSLIRFHQAVAIDALSVVSFGSGDGVVRSDDRGASCSPLPGLPLDVRGLTVDSGSPASLYASTVQGIFQITLTEVAPPRQRGVRVVSPR